MNRNDSPGSVPCQHPLLSLRGIEVCRSGKFILREVNLDIHSGERIVFTGASGSGKTTLLTLLAGGLKQTAGTLELHGEPVSHANLRDLRRCGAFIQQEPVASQEKVLDMLALPSLFHCNQELKTLQNPSHLRKKTEIILKAVNLPVTILDDNPMKLSGGEKLRVAIVRAILMERNLLFADEITASLDPVSKEMVMDLLLGDESPFDTIISISHDNEWISRCSRQVILEQGQIISGTQASQGHAEQGGLS